MGAFSNISKNNTLYQVYKIPIRLHFLLKKSVFLYPIPLVFYSVLNSSDFRVYKFTELSDLEKLKNKSRNAVPRSLGMLIKLI